jgi:hypothetical protein
VIAVTAQPLEELDELELELLLEELELLDEEDEALEELEELLLDELELLDDEDEEPLEPAQLGAIKLPSWLP